MSRHSFINRDRLHGTASHRRAPKMEKALAKRGNGQRVPGSGSGAEKADIRKFNKLFRIEAKTTKNKSFSITREMVQKLNEVSFAHGELPAFVVEFIDVRGRPEASFAVIRFDDFEELGIRDENPN